jgi:hypothetical protein
MKEERNVTHLRGPTDSWQQPRCPSELSAVRHAACLRESSPSWNGRTCRTSPGTKRDCSEFSLGRASDLFGPRAGGCPGAHRQRVPTAILSRPARTVAFRGARAQPANQGPCGDPGAAPPPGSSSSHNAATISSSITNSSSVGMTIIAACESRRLMNDSLSAGALRFFSMSSRIPRFPTAPHTFSLSFQE